ncbi:MAG: hypothetical protein A2096_00725 [Spirochaetes bacterium GWF1_41_5]|nr:MAG: hypothetical protein A2096_00725 [Spirochaetes bacterium GWF1_41_5]
MKRLLILIILLGVYNVYTQAPAPAAQPAAAQSGEKAADPDAEKNKTTAKLDIEEFLIDNFEDAGVYIGEMPRDIGIIRCMRKEGGPGTITKADPQKNKYVLGTKVQYFRTGYNWFGIYPPNELKIPGIAKKMSIWVAGRNYNHMVKIIIRNIKDGLNEVVLGKMNFLGWQQLSAPINNSIPQDDYKSFARRGVTFHSLLIQCDPMETSGSFFCYFDNFTAHTDMFMEKDENKDPDDMKDDW